MLAPYCLTYCIMSCSPVSCFFSSFCPLVFGWIFLRVRKKVKFQLEVLFNCSWGHTCPWVFTLCFKHPSRVSHFPKRSIRKAFKPANLAHCLPCASPGVNHSKGLYEVLPKSFRNWFLCNLTLTTKICRLHPLRSNRLLHWCLGSSVCNSRKCCWKSFYLFYKYHNYDIDSNSFNILRLFNFGRFSNTSRSVPPLP